MQQAPTVGSKAIDGCQAKSNFSVQCGITSGVPKSLGLSFEITTKRGHLAHADGRPPSA